MELAFISNPIDTNKSYWAVLTDSGEEVWTGSDQEEAQNKFDEITEEK